MYAVISRDRELSGIALTLIVVQAEDKIGFVDALLDILQAEQEAQIRLSSMRGP
jgi:hypothetical protein